MKRYLSFTSVALSACASQHSGPVAEDTATVALAVGRTQSADGSAPIAVEVGLGWLGEDDRDDSIFFRGSPLPVEGDTFSFAALQPPAETHDYRGVSIAYFMALEPGVYRGDELHEFLHGWDESTEAVLGLDRERVMVWINHEEIEAVLAAGLSEANCRTALPALPDSPDIADKTCTIIGQFSSFPDGYSCANVRLDSLGELAGFEQVSCNETTITLGVYEEVLSGAPVSVLNMD